MAIFSISAFSASPKQFRQLMWRYFILLPQEASTYWLSHPGSAVSTAKAKLTAVHSQVFTIVKILRSELMETEILDILHGDAGSEIKDSDKEDLYSPGESTSDDSGTDNGTDYQSPFVVPGRVCLTEHKEQDWLEVGDQPTLPDFQEVVCVA
ncbi:uncharacterized protein LOC126334909 [Schistocerca gregaria]|uniref:uncharacterized protein LOC126334909 n=1 Tax=Schistocerca gregaria TaxID=7010 RepID=UPI00211E5DAF|nr:uncharacterized protein LOC126334909 [Schistocerca gregaria]